VPREVGKDQVDHELHADQGRQGERVEQEGGEAEGTAAAPEGEVEGGDECQCQDLGERRDQLGDRGGRDDLGALRGVDQQDQGAADAGAGADAVDGGGVGWDMVPP
jgi:hypothetical protein